MSRVRNGRCFLFSLCLSSVGCAYGSTEMPLPTVESGGDVETDGEVPEVFTPPPPAPPAEDAGPLHGAQQGEPGTEQQLESLTCAPKGTYYLSFQPSAQSLEHGWCSGSVPGGSVVFGPSTGRAFVTEVNGIYVYTEYGNETIGTGAILMGDQCVLDILIVPN
jgi:hypothetical protein